MQNNIDAGKAIGTKGENLIKIVIADDDGCRSIHPVPDGKRYRGQKECGNILGDILLDSGKNLGLNIAGEGVGALIGKVSKVASDGIKRGGKSGTVWDNIISTADDMPTTKIPTTFKIDLDGRII